MKGVLLGRFLSVAGWGHRPPEMLGCSYHVRVEGNGDAATFTLAEFLPGSFIRRVLLVQEKNGKRIPKEDAPLLIVIDGDGGVRQAVRGVLDIRVTR